MKITGNKILITGAASGIGLEIARLFSLKDNTVIMVDRARGKLEEEAEKMGNAIPITVDLADEQALDSFIEKLRTNHKDLNIAILNAGIANDYTLFSDSYNPTYANSEMATNYLANVKLAHGLEPLLADQDNAAFVFTTSGLAFVPNLTYPTYSATKSALHSFAVASRLALERKGSSIKVFDLMPPLTETPLARGLDAPKISAAEVATWFFNSFEKDELEIHVADTEKIYQLFLEDPSQALVAINPRINPLRKL